jgi:hypothetical protein
VHDPIIRGIDGAAPEHMARAGTALCLFGNYIWLRVSGWTVKPKSAKRALWSVVYRSQWKKEALTHHTMSRKEEKENSPSNAELSSPKEAERPSNAELIRKYRRAHPPRALSSESSAARDESTLGVILGQGKSAPQESIAEFTSQFTHLSPEDVRGAGEVDAKSREGRAEREREDADIEALKKELGVDAPAVLDFGSEYPQGGQGGEKGHALPGFMRRLQGMGLSDDLLVSLADTDYGYGGISIEEEDDRLIYGGSSAGLGHVPKVNTTEILEIDPDAPAEKEGQQLPPLDGKAQTVEASSVCLNDLIRAAPRGNDNDNISDMLPAHSAVQGTVSFERRGMAAEGDTSTWVERVEAGDEIGDDNALAHSAFAKQKLAVPRPLKKKEEDGDFAMLGVIADKPSSAEEKEDAAREKPTEIMDVYEYTDIYGMERFQNKDTVVVCVRKQPMKDEKSSNVASSSSSSLPPAATSKIESAESTERAFEADAKIRGDKEPLEYDFGFEVSDGSGVDEAEMLEQEENEPEAAVVQRRVSSSRMKT